MKSFSILFFGFIVFCASSSLACKTTPESIDLDGSSFSNKITLQMTLNCGTNKLIVGAPNGKSFSIFLKNTNGICVSSLVEGKTREYCDVDFMKRNIDPIRDEVASRLKLRDSDGKIVGEVEYVSAPPPARIFVYSVGSNGQIDKSLPFLQIDAKKSLDWQVSVNGDANQGSIEATGSEKCPKGMIPENDKRISLNGKRYVSEDRGCGIGLRRDSTQRDSTTAPAQPVLRHNGVPVKPVGR